MSAAVALEEDDTAPAERPDGTPLISLRDITKTYRRGELAVEVLHGFSLDVRPGEFLAIMGTSGSGKSTLMNLIGLLDRPTSGSYRLDGQEVAALSADRRAVLRRETFGFVFQQYNLLASVDAVGNVEIPAVYAGRPRAARRERARELLTTLGLGDRLDHRPPQLSGGQQQRVSIARALMNGGEIILADEPTGALDSKSGAEVMRLLKDLNRQGRTVLLITHDPEVAAHADRVVEIRDGRIVSDTAMPAAVPAMAPDDAVRRLATVRGPSLTTDMVEAARMAVSALRSNLMRTLLTLLGIIIGVASVVAMLAIGDGARQRVMASITQMGTNLLLVRPGAPNVRRSGATATLIPDDAVAIETLPNVIVAAPEFPGDVTVRHGSNDYQTRANGTLPSFVVARDWPVAEGSFFGEADVETYAAVAVLGKTVRDSLFNQDEDPLGRYILVKSIPFQVIGVMSAKGASPGGWDYDDILYVPLTTGALRLFGERYVRSITVQIDDLSRLDETEEAIHQLLLKRHGTEDFQIRNMAAILEAATETQNTLTLLLGSIAAISLLVGGIGVMNIMLVSVTERTREIGVRMAAGARRRNIMLQFNTEALAICIVGGVIGVLCGFAAVWAFAAAGKPVLVSPGPVLLAFCCASGTGLLFGYLPARKAADLDPVVALAAE